MRSVQLLLAVGFLIVCNASYASLIYDVYQHYDRVRPDATPGDPLDKGFSLSGTITVSSTGFFGEGNVPFVDWDITEEVDDNGDLAADRTFRFTSANSTWDSSQTGSNPPLPVLEIDQNFIWLVDASDFDPGANGADNNLVLQSPASDLDQTVDWFNPFGANFLFTAGRTSDPADLNGVYEGSGGRVLIAIRSQHVPEPGSLALFAIGALGLAWNRRRRKVT